MTTISYDPVDCDALNFPRLEPMLVIASTSALAICHISLATKSLSVEKECIHYSSPGVANSTRVKLIDFKVINTNTVLVLMAQAAGVCTVAVYRRRCANSAWTAARQVSPTRDWQGHAGFQDLRYARDANSLPNAMLFTACSAATPLAGEAHVQPKRRLGKVPAWRWLCVAVDDRQSRTTSDDMDRLVPHQSYCNVLRSPCVVH